MENIISDIKSAEADTLDYLQQITQINITASHSASCLAQDDAPTPPSSLELVETSPAAPAATEPPRVSQEPRSASPEPVRALKVVPTGQTTPPAAGESLDDLEALSEAPGSKVSPITYCRMTISPTGEPIITTIGTARDSATVAGVDNFLRTMLSGDAQAARSGSKPTNPLRICKVDAEVFAKAAVLALDDGRRSYLGIAPPQVGEEFGSARALAQRLGYANPSTISNALTVSKSIGGGLVTLRGVSFCRKADWLRAKIMEQRAKEAGAFGGAE